MTGEPTTPDESCDAIVYVREQLRYSGRGRSGFERYYEQRPCKRRPIANGLCRQHQNCTFRWSDKYPLLKALTNSTPAIDQAEESGRDGRNRKEQQ
jgi:hypothetical protein